MFSFSGCIFSVWCRKPSRALPLRKVYRYPPSYEGGYFKGVVRGGTLSFELGVEHMRPPGVILGCLPPTYTFGDNLEYFLES